MIECDKNAKLQIFHTIPDMDKYLGYIFLTILLAVMKLEAATTHKHEHLHTSTKERTEDGAYIARDSHHFEGDDHDSR